MIVGRTPKHPIPNLSWKDTHHKSMHANGFLVFTANVHRPVINMIVIVGDSLTELSIVCSLPLKNYDSGPVQQITIIDKESAYCLGASTFTRSWVHPFLLGK